MLMRRSNTMSIFKTVGAIFSLLAVIALVCYKAYIFYYNR